MIRQNMRWWAWLAVPLSAAGCGGSECGPGTVDADGVCVAESAGTAGTGTTGTSTGTGAATGTGTGTGGTTNPECVDAQPCVGDFVLWEGADYTEARLCSSISGLLEIPGNAWLSEGDFACVESIGTDVVIEDQEILERLSFPALESIGGSFTYEMTTNRDGILDEVSAPRLRTVGDLLWLHTRDQLTTLDIGALESTDRLVLSSTLLRDLSGFDESTLRVTSFVGMSQNGCLPESEAQAFVDAVLGPGGDFDLFYNGFSAPCP